MDVLADSIAVHSRAIDKGVRLALQSQQVPSHVSRAIDEGVRLPLQSQQVPVMCVCIYLQHQVHSVCFAYVLSRLCAVNS